MDVVEILKNLVSFNTIDDKENTQIMNWISNYLESFGFKSEFIVDKKTNKMNLFSTIGTNPIITFSGHTDTVPDSDGWTTNPFKLEESGDNLYGLGSCDMKGGIASFLASLSQVDLQNLKYGINLLFTFDEEITFGGIKSFLDQNYKPSKYVIIPEPTEMKPIVATKGCLAFKANFNGISVHSSDPEKGINAILLANEFINDLNKYYSELKMETNSDFRIPYTTMNIGKIHGGDAINKVPDSCIMDFEFRTTNINQTKKIVNKVLEIANKHGGDIKIELSMDSMNCTDLSFIKLIEDLSNSNSETANYVTEASLIQKSDCNVILLGPGPMNAHIINEFVSKRDLIKLTDIFKNVIEHYCY